MERRGTTQNDPDMYRKTETNTAQPRPTQNNPDKPRPITERYRKHRTTQMNRKDRKGTDQPRPAHANPDKHRYTQITQTNPGIQKNYRKNRTLRKLQKNLAELRKSRNYSN